MSHPIAEIRYKKCRVRLKRTFRTALGEEHEETILLVAVVDKRGQIGYGEACPAPRITGSTLTSCEDFLQELANRLRVEQVYCYEKDKLHKIMKRLSRGVPEAKAAVDIAVYDIHSKEAGEPLWKFLGADKTEIQTDITVSLGDIESMLYEAKDYVSSGFNILKIKVGDDPLQDLSKLKILRQNIPENVKFRIDANQGWKDVRAVIQIIDQIPELGIELIEQPLPAKWLSELIELSGVSKVPIVLDESVHDLEDLVNLIQLGFRDGINIKLMKCGGVTEALKMGYVARAFRMKLMFGCMLETKISITAAACLASLFNADYVDLDSPLLIAETSVPIHGGVEYIGDKIILPKDPGLGIKVNDPDLG